MGNTAKTFSDVCGFLFNGKRRFLSRIDTVEGEYLFNLARGIENPTVVEIGRFMGGTTFLLAHATEGRVISIDNFSGWQWGPMTDRYLKAVLPREVELVIADSKTFKNDELNVDVLFFDGDHSFEGLRKDFEHWHPRVKRPGHILFHDCNLLSVKRFVDSLKLNLVCEVFSTRHYTV
jgi:predicted O-methyltransferase YrrM